MRCIKSVLLLPLLLPSLVWADATITPAANPPLTNLGEYRSVIEVVDEFLGGTTASGSVGGLGWNSGGTISAGTGNLANHPGTIIVDTGASSGTTARINCFGTGHIDYRATTISNVWIVKLAQTDAFTLARVGIMSSLGVSPPTEGVYFERLAADTNWFAVTMSNSTPATRADTGIAASTNWVRFRTEGSSASVRFYINDVLVATQTTQIPNQATLVCPGVQIINSEAASKKIEVDYFNMRVSGMAR